MRHGCDPHTNIALEHNLSSRHHNNTINIAIRQSGSYFANHAMYDYLRLELAGYVPPPPASVANPAIDVRLLQEVLHIFHNKAKLCQSHNRIEDILSHAATVQWMYDHHRRWEARDLYLAEGNVALQLGVEPQDRETFYARFRYRPRAVNMAPPSPYFAPTSIVSQPAITALMAADATEHPLLSTSRSSLAWVPSPLLELKSRF